MQAPGSDPCKPDEASDTPLFLRSWQLLTKGPSVLIPGIVIAVVVGILESMASEHNFEATRTAIDSLSAGNIVGSIGIPRAPSPKGVVAFMLVLEIVGGLFNQAWTAGIAVILWRRGFATLDDAVDAAFKNVMALALTFTVLAFAAIVLGMFTFSGGFLIVTFFAAYVFPPIAIEGKGLLPALRESFRIVTKSQGEPKLVMMIILGSTFLGSTVHMALSAFSLAGDIADELIKQVAQSYVMIVLVGFYMRKE